MSQDEMDKLIDYASTQEGRDLLAALEKGEEKAGNVDTAAFLANTISNGERRRIANRAGELPPPLPESIDKELGDLVASAQAQGWRVTGSGNGNLKWLPPEGDPVFSGSFLSDTRALKNHLARMERQGFDPSATGTLNEFADLTTTRQIERALANGDVDGVLKEFQINAEPITGTPFTSTSIPLVKAVMAESLERRFGITGLSGSDYVKPDSGVQRLLEVADLKRLGYSDSEIQAMLPALDRDRPEPSSKMTPEQEIERYVRGRFGKNPAGARAFLASDQPVPQIVDVSREPVGDTGTHVYRITYDSGIIETRDENGLLHSTGSIPAIVSRTSKQHEEWHHGKRSGSGVLGRLYREGRTLAESKSPSPAESRRRIAEADTTAMSPAYLEMAAIAPGYLKATLRSVSPWLPNLP